MCTSQTIYSYIECTNINHLLGGNIVTFAVENKYCMESVGLIPTISKLMLKSSVTGNAKDKSDARFAVNMT